MTGKTWTQSTPPPAGVTYEWVGERNNSQSVKRVDGVEVARNLVINPSYEETINSSDQIVSAGWEKSLRVKNLGAVHGGFSWGLVAGANASTYTYFGKRAVTSGSWVAFNTTVTLGSIGAEEAAYFAARVRSRATSSEPYSYYSEFTPTVEAPPYASVEVGRSVKIPDGHTDVQVLVYVYSQENKGAGPKEGWVVRTDGFHVASADTEDEALAQVETYFDGDTPDDRDGDTWLNPDEYKEYVWDSATKKWIPNPAAVSLSDNLFADPYFDQGMTHWTSGAQGGGTQGAVQGLSDINTLPGHRHSFALGPYVPGVYSQAAGPIPLPADRPPVKQGDVLQGSAWVMRGPGSTTGSEAVELRPWRNPSTGATVAGVMASVRVADMPVGEWVQISGSWTLQEEGAYTGFTRVYYTPNGKWGEDAPGVWIGYTFTAVNPGPPKGAVTEVGAVTAERLGVISEVSARSKARFPLTLAELPEHFRSGESVEMAAAGRAASASVWRWRQVSGPPVTLERHGGLARFIAPDVSSPTPIRVAVMASSVDGASRSDWHFYDFTITPALARFRAAEELEPAPARPAIVGYERGKRRIWNDALPPPGMPGRKDAEIIDLGIPDGDVQISEEFPQSAPAGGLHINPVTGDVYRNFGAGYNESGDTLGAPRRSAYWLASEGNIFKWSED